ncbi:hypothetical protein [Sphingobium tyrosinilyticum]|uniref:Amidohydrolase n=1 Tax=Sphingobium tyrosinilyticum TaxID=2715436 RepID=A0ABV9F4G1_9SPHN
MAQGRPFDPLASRTAISQVLARDASRLGALYKDIHQHPELAFEEKVTAAKLAPQMRDVGFTVT